MNEAIEGKEENTEQIIGNHGETEKSTTEYPPEPEIEQIFGKTEIWSNEVSISLLISLW